MSMLKIIKWCTLVISISVLWIFNWQVICWTYFLLAQLLIHISLLTTVLHYFYWQGLIRNLSIILAVPLPLSPRSIIQAWIKFVIFNIFAIIWSKPPEVSKELPWMSWNKFAAIFAISFLMKLNVLVIYLIY